MDTGSSVDRLKSEPFSLAMIRDVCRTLRHEPTLEFRAEHERVASGNRISRQVIYTPPRGGSALVDKLRNLESFLLSADGPDPLIRMAIGHYQFEAIHPFSDGNGRTGRILNILYLLHAGLLEIPILYLSRFIIQNKPDYYRLLREVTENANWEPWLLYILRGVEETAMCIFNRIGVIKALLDATVEKVRADAPKVYSRELIDLIFRQPYCKIGFVVDAKLGERKTASTYLRELENLGILVGERVGREVLYRHPALLDVLRG